MDRQRVTPLGWCLALMAIALCSDFRVGLGNVRVSPAEFMCVPIFAFAILRPRTLNFWPLLGITAAVGLGVLSSTAVAGNLLVVTAVRNLLVPLCLMTAVFYCRVAREDAMAALRALVVGCAAMSALGIYQAFAGLNALSLYSLRNAGLSDFNLQSVMAWKLSVAQTNKLLPGQRSLAFGLSLFSNNFGELLVYGLCALFGLWGSRRGSLAWSLPCVALILFAMFLSMARTAWLGAAVVALLFGVLYVRRPVLRVLMGLAIALGTMSAIGALPFLEFDRGGTLAGRAVLNGIAWAVYSGSDLYGLTLGALSPIYWSYSGAISNPHNTGLYMLVNFGVVGAAIFAVFVLYTLWLLFKRVRKRLRNEAWGLAAGGLLAAVWFSAYAQTWAVASASNSMFLFGLLSMMALSVIDGERNQSAKEAVSRPSRTTPGGIRLQPGE